MHWTERAGLVDEIVERLRTFHRHTHTSVEGRRKPGKLRGDHHREIPKKERGGHGDRASLLKTSIIITSFALSRLKWQSTPAFHYH